MKHARRVRNHAGMIFPAGPDEPYRRAFEWALSHKLDCFLTMLVSGEAIYELYVFLFP